MEKRPAEAGEGEPAAKAAKPGETINPLTGSPYSRRFHELLDRRRKLPCWEARGELLALLQKSQVVLIVGEPGGGKTTQLPQILLDAGYHVQDGQMRAILSAGPQAVAAISAAQRVAEELEVPLGSFVGYSAEFDDRTTQETLIKFTTHGLLLRELLSDPTLNRYSAIVMDEAHALTQAGDVCCGVLKEVLRRRPEFRAIVTSASGSAKKLQAHFDMAPLLCLPGRCHPVDLLYVAGPAAESDYLRSAIQTAVQIHTNEADGDVLVLLTSEEEVETACAEIRKELERNPAGSEALVVPLHAHLPAEKLQQAFGPAPAPQRPGGRGGRKVVVATDVAETSVAIDGICYVVDCGLSRQKLYNPRIRLDSAMVSPVSKASAALRAHAAGRVQPGKCFRLFPERAFTELPEGTHPEILRSDISSEMLTLKALGVDDLAHYEFVDPPAVETMMRALESLCNLGFIDLNGQLLPDGHLAAKFPVDLTVAKMLIESPKHRCSNEMLSIGAMLTAGEVFVRPPSGAARAAKLFTAAKSRLSHLDGDHLTLLNVFHAYKQSVQDGADSTRFCTENFVNQRVVRKAERVREQLRLLMESFNLSLVSTDFSEKEYYPNIRRCLASALFSRAAHVSREKLGGVYLLAKEGHEVGLHPSTCLQNKPEWVVYQEFVVTSKPYLRTVTQVKPEWLVELAPAYYDLKTFPPKSEAKLLLEKLAGAAIL
eukprot:TRINITY_DN32929_c0_g1_i1.p1 TRINITY_DN32929_c0_g1~~TRINITY_DN32929_c0_g1_i1.p1  ORF type:complete len:712 (-),score=150.91 TRINITY_DN32929_c0_g1_i1:104-2239(-)